MGITTNDFFENIYCAIFSPKAFFENKKADISVRAALATVLLTASIYKCAEGIFNASILNISFIGSFIAHLFGVSVVWFITALYFEYIAKIFNKADRLQKILYYSAFSPIPYIFFAPLNLVKQIGGTGYVIASDIEFLLYLWIIILYAFALRAAYEISFARSFMLLFLPFISIFFTIYWLVCFFMKMGYIFSI